MLGLVTFPALWGSRWVLVRWYFQVNALPGDRVKSIMAGKKYKLLCWKLLPNKQTTENKAWNNHEIRTMVEWVDMDFSDGFHIPCFTLWFMHTHLLKIHILFLLWEFPTHLYKWLRPPEYLRHSARLSIIYHRSSYATSKLQRLPCHQKSISSLRSWARLFP